jgi:Protein of unknown function (DUF3352)
VRKRRLIPVVVIAIAAAALGVVFGIRSGEQPPASGAATVVPASALAYIHVSTDPSRHGVKQALSVAGRLPDYGLFSAEVASRLTAIAAGGNANVDFTHDVRPWLGKEAALALLNTSSTTAGSLVVLDVSHRAAARAFLQRAGASSAGSYRGIQLFDYPSGTELAFVGHYLVFGQAASVRASIDVASGHSGSLAGSAAYQRAAAGEPAGRVADAYLSSAGVQRVLVPQGGAVGALGDLLYEPSLTGATISLSGTSTGAELYVHSALARQRGATHSQPFAPSLDRVIPAGSSLMFDVTGLDQIASHVLAAGAAGGIARNLGPLLARLGAALGSEGVNVQSLESLFSGETAVAIGPGGTTSGAGRNRSPELIVVTRTSNTSSTAAELANLEVPLSELFPAPSSGSGQVPEFNQRQVDGITAHQLSMTPGLELDYAVFHGLVVISTSLQGIGAVATHVRSLADERPYRATLGSHPQRVTSLVFLDFSQLLNLAEQTGLFRGARYKALRPDLERVRAIGLDSTRGEADSTAELFLQIQ